MLPFLFCTTTKSSTVQNSDSQFDTTTSCLAGVTTSLAVRTVRQQAENQMGGPGFLLTMLDEESSSDDDDDFDFDAEQGTAKRYPVHDCCEFEDAEALKVRKHGGGERVLWRFLSTPSLMSFGHFQFNCIPFFVAHNSIPFHFLVLIRISSMWTWNRRRKTKSRPSPLKLELKPVNTSLLRTTTIRQQRPMPPLSGIRQWFSSRPPS